jgi:hypothetical protein
VYLFHFSAFVNFPWQIIGIALLTLFTMTMLLKHYDKRHPFGHRGHLFLGTFATIFSAMAVLVFAFGLEANTWGFFHKTAGVYTSWPR